MKTNDHGWQDRSSNDSPPVASLLVGRAHISRPLIEFSNQQASAIHASAYPPHDAMWQRYAAGHATGNPESLPVALGKKWALEAADYDELERVAKIEIDHETIVRDLLNAITPDNFDWRYLENLFDTMEPSADMVEGFIEGASTVFDEI